MLLHIEADLFEFWGGSFWPQLACQSRFATPRYFEKCTLVCQPNYMVGAPCICMAEPERSNMSSSAYNVPHTKYMWTSTWPGLAGFGVLSADSVHAAAIELRGLPLYSQWLTEKANRNLSSLYLTTRFGVRIQFSVPPNKIPNFYKLLQTSTNFYHFDASL